jgi:hypothetical protein
MTIADVINTVRQGLQDLFDITAQKDYTNCEATADVEVDGSVLLTAAPVTYLLFLEKQLCDIRTFISNLPVLDPAERWVYDDNEDKFTTERPSETFRTKKSSKAIVLYPATPEHPAQTQLVTEDVIVGKWSVVKQSGAIPATHRQSWVRRVDALLRAVKSAREKANAETVARKVETHKMFDYLFGQSDD